MKCYIILWEGVNHMRGCSSQNVSDSYFSSWRRSLNQSFAILLERKSEPPFLSRSDLVLFLSTWLSSSHDGMYIYRDCGRNESATILLMYGFKVTLYYQMAESIHISRRRGRIWGIEEAEGRGGRGRPVAKYFWKHNVNAWRGSWIYQYVTENVIMK